MKKILSVLILIMSFVIAGCGSNTSLSSADVPSGTGAKERYFSRNTLSLPTANRDITSVRSTEYATFWIENVKDDNGNVVGNNICVCFHSDDAEVKTVCENVNAVIVTGFDVFDDGNQTKIIYTSYAEDKLVINEVTIADSEIGSDNFSNKDVKQLILDDTEISDSAFRFARICNDNVIVANDTDICLYDFGGNKISKVKLDYDVVDVVQNGDESYAVFVGKDGKSCLALIDWQNGKCKNEILIPGDGHTVGSIMDGKFISFDASTLYETNDKNEIKAICELDKYSLSSYKMKSLFGKEDTITAVMWDGINPEIDVVTLTECDAANAYSMSAELIDNNGRTQFLIAVPEESESLWYKKINEFNEQSDKYFAKYESFEYSSDYLGMGARPDGIVLYDSIEMTDLAKKGILSSYDELMEKSGFNSEYSLTPVAQKVLAYNGKMYGMSHNFTIMAQVFPVEDFNKLSAYDATTYMRWYADVWEKYGLGEADYFNYLRYMLGDIDEAMGDYSTEVSFTTEKIKNDLEVLKDCVVNHPGKADVNDPQTDMMMSMVVGGVSECSGLYPEIVANELFDYEGLPGKNKQTAVYTMANDIIGILETSECKEGVMEFVKFYLQSDNLYYDGASKSNDFVEITGELSIINECLERNFAMDVPYTYEVETDEDGCIISSEGKYLSQQNVDHVNSLFAGAVPYTAQMDEVIWIMLEELPDYLYGDKSVESVCDAIQSRVSVYLNETK